MPCETNRPDGNPLRFRSPVRPVPVEIPGPVDVRIHRLGCCTASAMPERPKGLKGIVATGLRKGVPAATALRSSRPGGSRNHLRARSVLAAEGTRVMPARGQGDRPVPRECGRPAPTGCSFRTRRGSADAEEEGGRIGDEGAGPLAPSAERSSTDGKGRSWGRARSGRWPEPIPGNQHPSDVRRDLGSVCFVVPDHAA